MSSLKERLGKITLAGGAIFAVTSAGCSSPVKTVEVKLPPCSINSQPKTIKVNMGNSTVVHMGDFALTRGNNPAGEFDIRLMSQEEASELSLNSIRKGSVFKEPETGRAVQITGQKVSGFLLQDTTKIFIESTCDPVETAS